MQKKHFIFYFILGTLLFFTATCFASEKAPRRIAILPVLNQSGNSEPAIEKYITGELEEKLHIPLNGTLKIHEYISLSDICRVLPEVIDPSRIENFDINRLKPAAEELSADLIVGVLITSLYEQEYTNFQRGERILNSNVTLRLIGYDRTKDEFINIKSQESYNDEYSLAGTINDLSHEALRKLFDKIDFKADVFPIIPTEKLT